MSGQSCLDLGQDEDQMVPFSDRVTFPFFLKISLSYRLDFSFSFPPCPRPLEGGPLFRESRGVSSVYNLRPPQFPHFFNSFSVFPPGPTGTIESPALFLFPSTPHKGLLQCSHPGVRLCVLEIPETRSFPFFFFLVGLRTQKFCFITAALPPTSLPPIPHSPQKSKSGFFPPNVLPCRTRAQSA